MNDDGTGGREPAMTHCRYCGSDRAEEDTVQRYDSGERNEGERDVYQVIVLCAACKRPFATIARN